MQLTAGSVEYHAHDGEPVLAQTGGSPTARPPAEPQTAGARPGEPQPTGWGANWQKKRS